MSKKKTGNIFAQDAAKTKKNLDEIMRDGETTQRGEEKVVKLFIRFPESVHEKVRQEAFDTKISMNTFVVRAIKKELNLE